MSFSNLLLPARAQAAIGGLTIGDAHQKLRSAGVLGFGTIPDSVIDAL